MATAQTSTVLRHIRQMAGGAAPERTDRQLLDDFAGRRDEAAFAALVGRHGAMVLRAARRVLGHEQDAEDAFQATFLVLARQAATIRRREALAGWLHGVARRTAMKAKRTAARRRAREGRQRPTAPPSAPALLWEEVRTVLDEELGRLAEPFRSAFVLCALEGKTAPEAAAALGCKEATVYTRMNRARRLLQKALAARGIELAALLGALAVAEGAAKAAPAALVRSAVRFGSLVAAGEPAAGGIPPRVAALAAGVTRAMFVSKVRIATAVVLALGVMGGAALWAQQVLPPKSAGKAPASRSSGGENAPGKADGKKVVDSITYRGCVLGPDGKPFAGAKVYLVLPHASQKASAVRATTGEDGRFRFTVSRKELLPAYAPPDVDVFSFLQVVAIAPGHGPDWTVLGKRAAGELTFRLARNDVTFNGRALDLQGKPLAGAKVHVLRVETTAEDDLADFIRAWKSQRDAHFALGRLTKVLHDPALAGLPKTVTADAEGRFRLPGAGAERIVVVSVEAPQVELATLRLLPRPAAEVKALAQAPSEAMMARGVVPPPPVYGLSFDHLAAPARIIRGVVRDHETGKPIKGARVSGHPLGRPTGTPPEAYTDAEGRYELRGLPKAGKYVLTAWPGDFSAYIPGGREVSAGDGTTAAEADFELYRGVEVRGRVTDKVTGKPVAAGVIYRPLDGNKHPAASLFRVVGKGCASPSVGTFTERVPPGPGVFLVTIRDADGANPYSQVRPSPEELAKAGLNEFMLHGVNAYRVIDAAADAKSLTCDVQVDPGRSVRGTVLGPDGKPLSGALAKGLTAVWPEPTALKAATFTAVALGPREPRELLFVHRERKLAGHLVVRGDEKGDVSVRLAPWGVLTGRVLDRDGRPLAGVRIQMGFLHPTFFQPVTWWAGPQGEEVATDRDGRFRAEGLTPGLKFRLSAARDNKFLQLAGTPDGMRTLAVEAGQTKDLGDLTVKPE